jgi:ATP-binding cassette, subfamily B, bacterial
MKSSVYSDLALLRRILCFARPVWLHLGGVFFLCLLAIPIGLLNPLPVKIAVDSVIDSQPLPDFLNFLIPSWIDRTPGNLAVMVAVMVVSIMALDKALSLANWVLPTYLAEEMILSVRSQLFRHAQRLSLSYHEIRGTSDSLYRIVNDAPALHGIVVWCLLPIVTSVLTLCGMLFVTARIDAHIAWIALALCPALFFLTGAYRERLSSGWGIVKEIESTAASVIHEALSAIRVVKAFGRENYEEQKFLTWARKGARQQVQMAMLGSGYYFLVALVLGLGMAASLYIGIRHVRSGQITLGSLLLVLGYLTQLYRPLEDLSKNFTGMQSGLASARRALALLDESPDVAERAKARPLIKATGRVQFRNVSFAYDRERPVLHDVNFDVAPGTRVGIAGPTGAGKTTLVSLLMRFYDPTTGSIELDGVDLRDYRVADLRNQFAIVLQDPVLFSATIGENIAYARPEASQEDIVCAARAAGAHDFVSAFPEGYQTMVGERGTRLSGGERQRISLARAFLKNAPILILDEPTSSIDIKTEAAIMKTMERLIVGHTTFIIAHRLSTLDNCDLLLRVEDGRPVELQVKGAATVPSGTLLERL